MLLPLFDQIEYWLSSKSASGSGSASVNTVKNDNHRDNDNDSSDNDSNDNDNEEINTVKKQQQQQEGLLRCPRVTELSMDDIGEAHQLIQSGKTVGKLVMIT
eukprot:CAMPEP_0170966582 /NCGR_PEP_ID=MMETSP0735-20130129/41869_1 /TAXON_ID=186038 /ORGANISM="Fragilariopsis kerguelensis, Strain L26-C5" /LENGTH=101 /DNA_ID=CAMNT_0011384689 /DNA_START=1 /DNA_END=306 /DNA_ORIENTATION=-